MIGKWKKLACLAILLLVNPMGCNGSDGDSSFDYQTCLKVCVQDICIKQARPVPFELQLFGWSCPDVCKYDCMHEVTTADVKEDQPIRQFYGKWPFIRLLGIQEPASVFASILNGLGHYYGYLRLSRLSPRRLLGIWKLWGLVSMNAWFWSCIFHSRDLGFTEMMDYFSAFAVILFQTYAVILHTGGFIAWRLKNVIAFALLLFYGNHVTYLATRHRFDYGYNMAVNVAFSVTHGLIWLIWCIHNWNTKPYVWRCVMVILACGAFMAFELLDFPPLFWTFDAHSLWHFGTALLIPQMYKFILEDALHEDKWQKI